MVRSSQNEHDPCPFLTNKLFLLNILSESKKMSVLHIRQWVIESILEFKWSDIFVLARLKQNLDLEDLLRNIMNFIVWRIRSLKS